MSSPVADHPLSEHPTSVHSPQHHEVLEVEPVAATGPLAGDPSILGLAALLPGGTSLGLTLVGFTEAESVGPGIAIFLAATGLFQLIACVWAAALGQSAVAAVFGIFSGFWLSFSLLLIGVVSGWFGLSATDANVVPMFLISWLVIFVALTLGTLRFPLAFTVVFALVVVAFSFVLAGNLAASTTLTAIGGVAVLTFTAIGVYLFASAASLATGGPAMNLGSPVIK